MGSNPDRDRGAYVIEQDTLPILASLHPVINWYQRVWAELVVVFD